MRRIMTIIGRMKLSRLTGLTGLMRLCLLFFMFNVQCSIFNDAYAQKIGGNVYGGGNKGNVNGKTTVTVKSGDIDRVFGGARMSNVGERTYVYINGKNRDNTESPTQNTNTGNILINQVYGGNDIAGTIGTSTEKPFDMAVDSLNAINPDEPEASVYATYNTFVRIDSEDTHAETGEGTSKNSSDAVYIGSLYAGGNGDYYYKNVADNDHRIYFSEADYGNHPDNYIAKNTTGFQQPELDKTYLEIDGGSIVYAFGGGNNATIRKNTVIHVDNPSDVVNEIYVNGDAQLTSERIAKMGINPGFTYPNSASYQIGSLFGGNNQVAMAIRPTWDLQSGLIRNVYSGGNKGAMTSPVGLLLDVNPTVTNPRKPLEINNIYGGCRMADVHPLNPADGSDIASTYIDITDKDENGQRKYNFPVGFAARLFIRGGKIDNVYGGNDIQGEVWGGNAVDIRTSINGNIYGGGNGAYPYTDNSTLATNPVWSDLYYNPGSNSVEALTAIRPHAEQVSIHITGTQEKPTIIRGNVFCGGNCATLKNDKPEEARVELKLGSYVTAENVFLGNNGAHMVNKEVLKYYKGYVKDKEVSLTEDATNFPYDFSSIDLTQPEQMSKYMDAVAMNLKPKILVDNRQKGDDADYEEYSSWIGSFYCGGNVGSMTYAGPLNMKLNEAINVYEKVVGGCNNANVPVYYANEGNTNPLNARYEGGIMGSPDERVENGYTDTDGNIKDRLIIDCDKLQIKPMRWKDDTKTELIWNTVTWQNTYNPIASGTTLTPGNTYYEKTTKDKYTAYTADGTETASENEYYEYATETKTYNPIASGTTLTSGNTYFTKNTVTDEYEAFTAVGTETVTENKYYEYAGGYTETGTGEGTGEATTADLSRRLKGGNLYGGCYNSGHVNGNVVINQVNNIIDRQLVFAQVQEDDDRPLYDHDENFKYHITQRNSGVILDEQGMDEMASALSIFGGGYGKDSEIWGSTTINIKRGYSFQIYGGGQQGVIGKSTDITTEPDGTYDSNTGKYAFNKKWYQYNDKYSTTINLFGEHAGTTRAEDNTIYIAESEFLYAGGYEGPVIGDTHIYLGNGRIFDAFAGGCNADILGHSEAYVGRAWNYYKATPGYDDGFPHIRDYVYGGNDLGGRILGSFEIGNRFQENDKTYRPLSDLKTATYVEYLQGYTPAIYGGCYGGYDYSEPKYAFVPQKPYIHNSVVNFRPKNDTPFSTKSGVRRVFGAGEGASGQRDGDAMQEHSYVHVHIPDGMENFASTEVFGAGNYYGVGMSHYIDPATATDEELEEASAIIDLVGGQIAAAYGGSYNEGITRRTEVNVPTGSTIKIGKIFGGSYGTNALPPCDVYDANVNFASGDAIVTGGIYGGNNNVRRTVYSKVNISSPVISDRTKGYLGTVYGAGYGTFTWSEYTEVNLLPGAQVYEVYGGGQLGQVLNAESIQAYMTSFTHPHSLNELPEHIRVLYDPADFPKWDQMWKDAWTIGTFKNDNVNVNDNNSPPTTYYTPSAQFTNYVDNAATNLSNSLAREAEIDDREPYDANTNPNGPKQAKKYNTNVIIHEGATVSNYAYGGGLGEVNQPNAGDVLGSTYIALLGGNVKKDIYAAGTTGNVYNIYGGKFTASANAYILGGSARNVYGGGWKGSVGFHSGDITTSPAEDVPGETHVVIGNLEDVVKQDSLALQNGENHITKHGFYYGRPAIQRNAYGGGEGGAVYGTAHLTFNNGYVGYEFNPDGTDDQKTTDHDERYVEKIEDDTYTVDGHFVANARLNDAGCLFGGGYIDNSSVDFTNVKVMGGHLRNSVFGGGEIAAIGRGTIEASGQNKATRTLTGLFRPGKTSVEMFSGHVHRNVFGGGRGYNNLGEQGNLYSDGFVFGQTEVHVHGGEIGTAEGLTKGYGNVFGGGDIGYVYSAYENPDGSFGKGVKDGRRYDPLYQGYYYKHDWADNGNFVTVNTGETYTAEAATAYNTAHGYTSTDAGYVKEGDYVTERQFTEDCKVLIEPQCKAIADVTINSHAYTPGQYVPIDDLNTLGNKDDARWDCLDKFGIIIHNAVFAGGNTSPGSAASYANATSVFGNATASIYDIYNRDMITLGTGHTGGLYGDGNLTFVDGYRELNITNYGTDYYAITKEINIDQYHALPEREAAYYELRYKCKAECKDRDGTTYKPADSGSSSKASTLTADEIVALWTKKGQNGEIIILNNQGEEGGTPMLTSQNSGTTFIPNPTYWEENGVCSRYAGRLMNSIQRADFCGVFGSRMVMQGAQDRVPETVDYTNYTINRVREVSLNKKKFDESEQEPTTNFHGNYFGIYNIVNYLGALTSDVDFGGEDGGGDVRVTDNTDTSTYKCDAGENGEEYGTATYYDWKKAFHDERKRNNGNSHNQVALASGVYLELTTEESTGPGLYEKVWGPITGVIELDLINVQTGIGGGFVYAKNVHGVRTHTNRENTTLTTLNDKAVTQWDYEYDSDDGNKREWQSSGNFVHSTQTIIDDCYNISGRYLTDGFVPAHYWFIKGQVYVYDQYISAYTGVPNAYSESVDIPLTITAASHGTMKLLNVQPNYYAFYSSPSNQTRIQSGKKIVINDVDYYLNDPISFWDYNMLSASEKAMFVKDTYISIAECKIGEETIKADTVLLPEQYTALLARAPKKQLEDDEQAPYISTVFDTKLQKDVPFESVFRSSNNLGHQTGYILTYDVNNPKEWNTWYTQKTSDINSETGDTIRGKIKKEVYDSNTTDKTLYHDGPTYYPTENGLFGQNEYKVGNIINKSIYTTYQDVVTNHNDAITGSHKTQAEFYPAFIVKNEVFTELNDGHNTPQHLNPGATIAKEFYSDASWNDMKSSVDTAYVSTKTIQLSKTEFIYVNTKMTPAEKQAYYDRFNKTGATDAEKQIAEDIKNMIVPAYYCTKEGYYGGNYYEAGKNYRGLEAWSSMSEDDRSHFNFNYDALDLLIDKDYSHNEGHKYQYDSAAGTEAGAYANPATYSLKTPVDYSATYRGGTDLTYTYGGTEKTITQNQEIGREEYESLVNEQRHFAPISVPVIAEGKNHVVYIVSTAFIHGESSYAVGQTIDYNEYSGLGSDQEKITQLTFTRNDLDKDTDGETPIATSFYYCREGYTAASNLSSLNITGAENTCTSTTSVPKGIVIKYGTYKDLPNKQKNFTIHGISPTETSTLYVSRNSDIYDLSKEKIITVVYQYDYEESDAQAQHITPVSERHVVNIHIQFKSGVPEVEDITKPGIVLPGTSVSLREPTVTPGAYEITGAGWELFETPRDAESHTNGVEYSPTFDPLYWYQNGYYVAYYARTYLGKTYSNSVPLSVANYHDIADVMSDANKAHHMYIDHPNMLRDPKIYLNNYRTLPNTDPRYGKNALDEFKRLFDLSILDENSANANGVVTSGDSENPHPLEGHHLLIDDNYRDRALRNLEFILNTDIDHTGSSWTPIGGNNIYDIPSTENNDEATSGATKGECFDGVLHGDGHTISGLDKSLFAHLCGEVYNLGVTGTFKDAGIADTGYGYIENCWIKSTATVPQETKPQAIFGAPLASGFKQVVNCYYPGSNEGLYDNGNSTAHKVPEKDFYNGEVTYNLNGFYLYKRYNDGVNTASGEEYKYWKDGEATPQTGKYGSNEAYCSSGYNGQKYVEDRFADGDFQYAGGTIPDDLNERLVMDEEGNPHYYPIWPDDYLFFGQALTYGYVDTRSHQELPSYIWRSGGRLETAENSNRVYRAPAYFRNGDMDVAHFNQYAIFADTWKGNSAIEVYKGMTAIDFSGGNGDLAGGYKLGFVGNNYKHFYQPLLDDDGLTNFRNEGLTKNLLVYTDNAANPSTTASGITANKIKDIVIDPTYTETNSDYKTVAYQQFATLDGHWVQKKAEATNNIWYESVNDHLLADKNDFNAPIAYEFQNTKRMWHQRTPANYVNRTSGWEAISLPFTADMVTTDTKGEITHFYNGSEKSKNSESKIGHEYWLRELDATKDLALKTGTTETLTANFQYPYAKSSDKDKDVSNTFLWDYYYEAAAGHKRKDANKDTYQEYYRNPRSYPTYARLTGGTPYIIGFPGVIYYEFDLSGQFEARTTYSQPERVKQQVITFVSKEGATINVSDQELENMKKTVKYGNAEYIFKPSYLNERLTPYPAAPTEGNIYDVNFALNEAGNNFALVNGTAQSINAFRPFFTGQKTAATNTREYNFIDFENITDGTMEPDEDVLGREKGILEIFARGRNIHTISHLKEKVNIRIVNAAGAVMKTYTLEPGKTIVTPITNPGTYIVNKKKLFIK